MGRAVRASQGGGWGQQARLSQSGKEQILSHELGN